MRVAGVDAWRGGWVAVVLARDRFGQALAAASLAEVVQGCAGAAAICVDMPLGLVERGWREADLLAAARLGRFRSRVFVVPPRAVWDAPSHAEAVQRCRELTDPPGGCSVQAWALKDKLREANALRSGGTRSLSEAHPELSFAQMNGGLPVAASKKTWNGQMARRALLARAGVRLPDDLGGAGAVPPDDVLDAAAVAWTAGRMARGEALSLPDPPERGADGLPIAIWR